MSARKVVIRVKMPEKIDLRDYSTHSETNTQSHGKQLIIDVLSQLIEHTDQIVKSSAGDDKKKNQFRVTQFKKALSSIKSYPDEITSGKQARELPGIGKGIADRIDTILTTGTLPELSETAHIDETTRLINELTTVTGIGESNARKFIEMGVTSLDDLRRKFNKGLIKLTHHMQVGLKYYDEIQQKIPYREIVELGEIMRKCIHQIYPEIMVEICGSHRRQKAFSGDIDVLMTSKSIATEDDLIMSQIHYLKDIVHELKSIGFVIDDLTSQGDTKYMGVCIHPQTKIGRRIDIRFVTYDSYYPAILYFTGSMMLNKLMRTHALKKHFTLNEYGLYRLVTGEKEEKIVAHSEKEIFDILGLVYLEPKEREIV
jgi:DNA polymerase/3'-5' exonuclease PolX